MQLRSKTKSFQEEKGKIKQIMKKPQSYQDHHIDTVVDFISDAPAERAVTFNDNPVDETRYILLRLHYTSQEPRPPPTAIPIDLMTPAADAIPRPEPAEQ